MKKLDDIYIRHVLKQGNSRMIAIPKNWAEIGEKICITVQDANTLIISKKVQTAGGSHE